MADTILNAIFGLMAAILIIVIGHVLILESYDRGYKHGQVDCIRGEVRYRIEKKEVDEVVEIGERNRPKD